MEVLGRGVVVSAEWGEDNEGAGEVSFSEGKKTRNRRRERWSVWYYLYCLLLKEEGFWRAGVGLKCGFAGV